MHFFSFLATAFMSWHLLNLQCTAQREYIPYENVEDICGTCTCTQNATEEANFNELDCSNRDFRHILARWPEQFNNSNDSIREKNIVTGVFSGNRINILQQLPPTNAILRFFCQHCHITYIQAPTFMDVPNIIELNLAWNSLRTNELIPDIFRGHYNTTGYETISLEILDLSHNNLITLNRHLFQYTTNLVELNLSSNPFKKLDESTIKAISSITTLKNLDLSFTGIRILDYRLFEKLMSLEYLNLAGNEFTQMPEKIYLIGHSLKHLNLAANLFEEFNEESFLGLKVLQHLNISYMPTLKAIQNNTFTRFETLTHLSCTYNSNLDAFRLDGLLHCEHLQYLDLSYCHLNTLFLSINIPDLTNSSITLYNNSRGFRPWTKLHTFNMKGNFWLCDCYFVHLIHYIEGDLCEKRNNDIICDKPQQISGISLRNLTTTQICSMQMPQKYPIIDEGLPRFRRHRYIILMLITTTIVALIGVVLGFALVCIRRHLKREDFGIEPIRYTSVRNCNLSTFP